MRVALGQCVRPGVPCATPPFEVLQAVGVAPIGNTKDGADGANLHSVTTDSSQGAKLTAQELADREAMLRDLHGAVSLLKVELCGILLAMQAPVHAVTPVP